MQIASRFTIAVHILTCINYVEGHIFITSEFLAGSIGVNPVIIRQIIIKLKKAGIVKVGRGRGGIKAERNLDGVRLYDVYVAVDAVSRRGMFRFHENPNPKCPVGKKIHDALDGSLREIQRVFEEKLKSITIGDIMTAGDFGEYNGPHPENIMPKIIEAIRRDRVLDTFFQKP